jgi:hypothetical protein
LKKHIRTVAAFKNKCCSQKKLRIDRFYSFKLDGFTICSFLQEFAESNLVNLAVNPNPIPEFAKLVETLLEIGFYL